MKVSHDNDQFRHKVRPALKSKQEEFFTFGYGRVSEEDIWDFLVSKKWRKESSDMKLFEVVQDILSLKVGEFMNYTQVKALKEAEFTLDNEEERLELLK
ncbi:post-transcriptional regulator [Bacillus sp. V3B]|uniref:post-transcriptional regulator n=1 Tax=Bacillus sp. V3B TaxID=2804915 RepID=UPI00210E1AD1|nr:post-transcriptional regulator [Bacillus sp. V3B]MCQ6273558.1 post-transcriptional regulator [Bacillus sp. V3B]